MTIYEATYPFTISVLLNEIDSGQSVLPDFQRDFVWDPSSTVGLIVSIANQFPAGSILRVRDGQRAFATRVFEGAPIRNHLHTFLILDGQQRLTSLYQSFFGQGDHRFFIDLNKALSEMTLDGEDSVFFKRANRRGVSDLESNIESHVSEYVLPLSVFRNREGGFWKWTSDFRDRLPENDRANFENQIRALYQSHLKFFDEYQFPVVTLNESVTADALCTIFETINMSGVKLTVFELMTARFWRFGINLREKWEKAIEEFSILSDYDIEPYSVLQAVSLASTGSCQKRDVLGMDEAQFNAYWDRSVGQMAHGLEILRDDCKIMTKGWLPTPSMLGPLAAILVNVSEAHGAELGARRQKVVRWIWCAIFGRRYEAAANTRAEKDVREMKEWFENGTTPEIIENFRFDIELLREASSRANPIYKGVICLVLSGSPEARDFHKHTKISHEMLTTKWVDDHHIFPKSFLRNEKGITNKGLIDCVLNRTLIDRTTNQIISDKAPSIYLSELDSHFNADEILNTHVIPIGSSSSLRRDDYDAFLDDRSKLISGEISRVTGWVNAGLL
jgi:hypothetical protein